MIDFELVREHTKRFEDEIRKRGLKSVDLKKVLSLDAERRAGIQKLEELRAEQKKLSEQVAKASPSEKKKLVTSARALAKKIKEVEPSVAKLERDFVAVASLVPTLAHSSVPVGTSSADNRVDALFGTKPVFDFAPKSHWQLFDQLGLVDTKRAARVSGSRFAYLTGDLVLLEWALLRFIMDDILQRGFVPMMTPTLVKEEAMFGAGMFPIDRQEVYALPDDGLFLIGTSEISMLNYHAHETLQLKDQPTRYAGFTTNYRREAGTYGKDVKGIIRMHQFDKLELFVFISQESSWQYFEKELISIPESILEKLGLHFRRVSLCTADLPRKFHKTYDLEVWMPSENRYVETHSISHAGDYQARRLGIKYVNAEGQRRYAHTLNATAMAFSRLPSAMAEQFQTVDGKIRIPEVLQPYLHNKEYLGSSE
jgi:seryl-tRNA synthetase